MSEKNLTVRRLISTVSVIALTSGVLLVGNTQSANAAPTTGGTLQLYTHAEQFPAVDPTNMYTGRDIALFGAYIERTLVNFKPVAGADGNTLVADMATNTGVPSNKAKTWKLTLRPGVTWEDGSAVTCADVKYGWSRTFALDVFDSGPAYAISWLDIPKDADGSSAYKGPYKKTGQALFDKAITCSADNRTITFNLSRSVTDFNYFLTYTAAGPVKQKWDTGEKYDLAVKSNGPYKITKYKINDEMIMERNPNWNKASDPIRTPYVDTIRVTFGLDEDVRDELDMTDAIPTGINLDGLQVQNTPVFFEDPKNASRRNIHDSNYTSYLTANNSAGHLDCLEVRQALFYAFPNQALIDLNGGTKYYGTPGDGIIPKNLSLDYAPTTGNIHDPNFKIEGNPVYANTLLAQAKTKCPTAYAKATDATKGILYYRPDTASNKKTAVIVEDAYKKAGIVINTVYKPVGTYNSMLETYKSETDLFGSAWAPDWPNASTVVPEMWGDGCCNYTKNEKTPEYKPFIAKVDKALAELDRKKQAALWKELNQYGMDQYWYIRTVFGKGTETWGSKIGGVFLWVPQQSLPWGKLYLKS
jgi:peptide/nickel transport system substrate-binding protein